MKSLSSNRQGQDARLASLHHRDEHVAGLLAEVGRGLGVVLLAHVERLDKRLPALIHACVRAGHLGEGNAGLGRPLLVERVASVIEHRCLEERGPISLCVRTRAEEGMPWHENDDGLDTNLAKN